MVPCAADIGKVTDNGNTTMHEMIRKHYRKGASKNFHCPLALQLHFPSYLYIFTFLY